MKIKICGITRPEDADAAVAAGADMLGFVFRSGTPRALDPAASGWIHDVTGVEKVGVFLDSPLQEVVRIRDLLALEWVQLHGDEPDSYLEALGERVIRRVPVSSAIDWDRVADLAGRCLPLFDPGAGDGVAWAWEALEESPPGIRFGLAGGLTPDNVADAVRTVQPYLVDVSSGVEAAPAIKDHVKIRDFIAAARTADSS
ncbi:MAG: phosphoribosylanthranilate isomerase [Thermoanaerobaculales bacterium]|nr:phosphoribosylanthranilate isomerase [Thermoanaerobaculales bacterium]